MQRHRRRTALLNDERPATPEAKGLRALFGEVFLPRGGTRSSSGHFGPALTCPWAVPELFELGQRHDFRHGFTRGPAVTPVFIG